MPGYLSWLLVILQYNTVNQKKIPKTSGSNQCDKMYALIFTNKFKCPEHRNPKVNILIVVPGLCGTERIHRLRENTHTHTETAVPPRCLLKGKVQIENYIKKNNFKSSLSFTHNSPITSAQLPLCYFLFLKKTLDAFSCGLCRINKLSFYVHSRQSK